MAKKLISIRISEELYKAIKRIKENWNELNRTDIIEELIREGLKRKRRKALAQWYSLVFILIAITTFLIQCITFI